MDKSKTGENRRLLLWQDDSGDLIATDWTAQGTLRYRIRDRIDLTQNKPLKGTPLAAASDDAGVIHVFYLSTGDKIGYIFHPPTGDWKSGGVLGRDGDTI